MKFYFLYFSYHSLNLKLLLYCLKIKKKSSNFKNNKQEADNAVCVGGLLDHRGRPEDQGLTRGDHARSRGSESNTERRDCFSYPLILSLSLSHIHTHTNSVVVVVVGLEAGFYANRRGGCGFPSR